MTARKRASVPAAINEPEATPEPQQISLEAIREELSEKHRECFIELHRLEGELRGIDRFLAYLNPQAPIQPADPAEGETE